MFLFRRSKGSGNTNKYSDQPVASRSNLDHSSCQSTGSQHALSNTISGITETSVSPQQQINARLEHNGNLKKGAHCSVQRKPLLVVECDFDIDSENDSCSSESESESETVSNNDPESSSKDSSDRGISTISASKEAQGMDEPDATYDIDGTIYLSARLTESTSQADKPTADREQRNDVERGNLSQDRSGSNTAASSNTIGDNYATETTPALEMGSVSDPLMITPTPAFCLKSRQLTGSKDIVLINVFHHNMIPMVPWHIPRFTYADRPYFVAHKPYSSMYEPTSTVVNTNLPQQGRTAHQHSVRSHADVKHSHSSHTDAKHSHPSLSPRRGGDGGGVGASGGGEGTGAGGAGGREAGGREAGRAAGIASSLCKPLEQGGGYNSKPCRVFEVCVSSDYWQPPNDKYFINIYDANVLAKMIRSINTLFKESICEIQFSRVKDAKQLGRPEGADPAHFDIPHARWQQLLKQQQQLQQLKEQQTAAKLQQGSTGRGVHGGSVAGGGGGGGGQQQGKVELRSKLRASISSLDPRHSPVRQQQRQSAGKHEGHGSPFRLSFTPTSAQTMGSLVIPSALRLPTTGTGDNSDSESESESVSESGRGIIRGGPSWPGSRWGAAAAAGGNKDEEEDDDNGGDDNESVCSTSTSHTAVAAAVAQFQAVAAASAQHKAKGGGGSGVGTSGIGMSSTRLNSMLIPSPITTVTQQGQGSWEGEKAAVLSPRSFRYQNASANSISSGVAASLKLESIKNPLVLLGWMIWLPECKKFKSSVFVVTDIRKNLLSRTEFLLSSYTEAAWWSCLKRAENKTGQEFRPLKRVLDPLQHATGVGCAIALPPPFDPLLKDSATPCAGSSAANNHSSHPGAITTTTTIAATTTDSSGSSDGVAGKETLPIASMQTQQRSSTAQRSTSNSATNIAAATSAATGAASDVHSHSQHHHQHQPRRVSIAREFTEKDRLKAARKGAQAVLHKTGGGAALSSPEKKRGSFLGFKQQPKEQQPKEEEKLQQQKSKEEQQQATARVRTNLLRGSTASATAAVSVKRTAHLPAGDDGGGGSNH